MRLSFSRIISTASWQRFLHFGFQQLSWSTFISGWSCDDIPASDTTTTAWALTGTRRRALEEVEDYYEQLVRR